MSIILRDYTEKDFEAYSRLKMDAETMYYLQDIQLHPVEEARRDFAEVDIRKTDRVTITAKQIRRITREEGCVWADQRADRHQERQ